MTETITIAAPPGAVVGAIARAIEARDGRWEADGEGGKLWIPVVAGIRRGFLFAVATVSAARGDTAGHRRQSGGETVLEISQIENHLRLNPGAVMVLLFGAVGGIVAMLWPFFPGLLQVGPLGAILAVAAWLLVAARIRNSGLEEFLQLVEDLATQEEESAGSGAETEISRDR